MHPFLNSNLLNRLASKLRFSQSHLAKPRMRFSSDKRHHRLTDLGKWQSLGSTILTTRVQEQRMPASLGYLRILRSIMIPTSIISSSTITITCLGLVNNLLPWWAFPFQGSMLTGSAIRTCLVPLMSRPTTTKKVRISLSV